MPTKTKLKPLPTSAQLEIMLRVREDFLHNNCYSYLCQYVGRICFDRNLLGSGGTNDLSILIPLFNRTAARKFCKDASQYSIMWFSPINASKKRLEYINWIIDQLIAKQVKESYSQYKRHINLWIGMKARIKVVYSKFAVIISK